MSIQPTETFVPSPAPRSNSTTNPNNMFASAGKYVINEAYQEANASSHSSMRKVTDEFNKYGTRSLDTASYASMDEWTQSKVAQNNVRVTNFWIDNLAKGINGRELLEMSDRATSSDQTNYYREGLKQIIDFIPDATKQQTITRRDADGNPTDQVITISEIVGNPALLEQYINDPALKSAIISAGKALKTSNNLNDAIRYDKRDVSGLDKVGAALHLGLSVAGAGGLTALAGYGVCAGVAGCWGGIGATTIGTSLGLAQGSALATIAGVALPVLGIGALVGLAVVAAAVVIPYAINAVSEGSQYLKEGRNDNPSGTWFSGKDFAASFAWLTGINAKEN